MTATLDANALLDAMGDFILELDETSRCVATAGSARLPFLPADRFLSKKVHEFMPPDASGAMVRAIEEVLRDGRPRALEYALATRDGPHYFEARIARGNERRVVAVVRDIHARKVAEQQWRASEAHLRESEQRFRVMADHAPVLLWMAGTDAECTFFNRGWLEFTGRPLDKELGVGWAESVHFEDFQACMNTYLEAFVERRAFQMEYRMRRADGAFRWILDSGAPRFGPDGEFEGYIGSCIDVTELKVVEQRTRRLNGELETRLREREVLLREVHHRVKNNLQVMSSMLNLQAATLPVPARRALEEGQRRIHAIGLLHEKLCEGDDMAHVDFAAYTRHLVEGVRSAIGNPQSSLTVSTDDVSLNIDQAVPCGLLINELVTNAFRHAFPDGRSGAVHVAIERTEGRVAVSVSDDGAGLPLAAASELELRKPTTLGFDIVATVCRQLGATLEIQHERGTTIRVAFRVTE